MKIPKPMITSERFQTEDASKYIYIYTYIYIYVYQNFRFWFCSCLVLKSDRSVRNRSETEVKVNHKFDTSAASAPRSALDVPKTLPATDRLTKDKKSYQGGETQQTTRMLRLIGTGLPSLVHEAFTYLIDQYIN